jgi:hypothetical protein
VENESYAARLHASAIQCLIDEGEQEAAKLLLECSVRYTDDDRLAYITFIVPRGIYECLSPLTESFNDPIFGYFRRSNPEQLITLPRKSQIAHAIATAFDAFTDYPIKFSLRRSLLQINEKWKDEFHAILEGTDIHNQGVQFSEDQPVHIWKNLRFRSQTEIRIAEALDRAGVLFLPNCRARLGFKTRENREADFLVCCDGKWGILEIDSDRFHQSAADDHERDRLFKAHGISAIEHFDQGECWENADGVVKKFLYLLRKQNR